MSIAEEVIELDLLIDRFCEEYLQARGYPAGFVAPWTDSVPWWIRPGSMLPCVSILGEVLDEVIGKLHFQK
jgi:hypothetical protein